MSTVGVEVIGGDRIRAVLDRVEDGLDAKVSEALSVVADKVKEDAKDYCPVDTGSLKASIRREAVARTSGNTWGIGVRAGGYVTNPKTGQKVNYAAHVEFGTSRMAPRAFLRPALRANAQAIRDAVAKAVGETIREAEGSE